MMLNYPAILSHRRSTTVSLETYPIYSFTVHKKAADLLTLPKACSQIAMNNFREVRVL